KVDTRLTTVFRYIRKRVRIYSTLFGGLALITLASYALMTWIPTTFIRRFGWASGDIGISYGLILAIAGSIGVFMAGWLSEILTRRGTKSVPMWTIIWCAIGGLVFGVLAPIMPT